MLLLLNFLSGWTFPELRGGDPWISISFYGLLSRAVSHEVLINRSLKRMVSALLKANVVVLVTASVLPLKTLKSIITWLLQPRLPLTSPSLTSSLLFVSTRPSGASFLLVAHVGKLSLTHPDGALPECCCGIGRSVTGTPIPRHSFMSSSCSFTGNKSLSRPSHGVLPGEPVSIPHSTPVM